MKISILTFLLLASFNSFSQNILDHFKIKEIKEIEISFSPDMSIDDGKNVVSKVSTDDSFIKKIKLMLSDLPSTGGLWKDFPQTIPTWKIKIIDQNEKAHSILYFGIKLRVPDSSMGSFYYGKIKNDSEKKLYLAIRSFMVGDWYSEK